MPRLSFVRPLWWRKKWATEEDGIIYRAQVTTLSFGYNPLTETISASLTYRTEFFCDVQNRWKLTWNECEHHFRKSESSELLCNVTLTSTITV